MSSEARAAQQWNQGDDAVVAIASAVAYGNVGLRATVAGLHALRRRAIELPTVVLSNHPGMGRPAGLRLPALELGAMMDALDRLGVLERAAAVTTGYFASADQVVAVADRIARLKDRRADLIVLVDPVIGDEEGGLYVEEPVAAAIRDRLLPIASIATPNRFELGWLSSRTIATGEDAVAAARALPVPETVATSAAASASEIVTLAIAGGTVERWASSRRAAVPHGTGDLLAGLYLGHRLSGADAAASLAGAMRLLETVVERSAGRPVLDLEIPC
jgi:pyridoxine kinase